jgi:hypothetical protein
MPPERGRRERHPCVGVTPQRGGEGRRAHWDEVTDQEDHQTAHRHARAADSGM